MHRQILAILPHDHNQRISWDMRFPYTIPKHKTKSLDNSACLSRMRDKTRTPYAMQSLARHHDLFPIHFQHHFFAICMYKTAIACKARSVNTRTTFVKGHTYRAGQICIRSNLRCYIRNSVIGANRGCRLASSPSRTASDTVVIAAVANADTTSRSCSDPFVEVVVSVDAGGMLLMMLVNAAARIKAAQADIAGLWNCDGGNNERRHRRC